MVSYASSFVAAPTYGLCVPQACEKSSFWVPGTQKMDVFGTCRIPTTEDRYPNVLWPLIPEPFFLSCKGSAGLLTFEHAEMAMRLVRTTAELLLVLYLRLVLFIEQGPLVWVLILFAAYLIAGVIVGGGIINLAGCIYLVVFYVIAPLIMLMQDLWIDGNILTKLRP